MEKFCQDPTLDARPLRVYALNFETINSYHNCEDLDRPPSVNSAPTMPYLPHLIAITLAADRRELSRIQNGEWA
jgi:hypothetical protein